MPLYIFEVRRLIGNVYAGRLSVEGKSADAALARAEAWAAEGKFSVSDQREAEPQTTAVPDGYLVFRRA
jgi:hypothetical protein